MLALWILPWALGVAQSESSAAQTIRALLDQENYRTSCLEHIVEENERKTPLEALTCAHAYACSQAYGAQTPQTAGCINRSMDVLTQMAEFEAAVQEAFQSAKEDIQQYWRDCGALPERVTSCAMAAKDMYCAQRDGNVWKHMLSYEAYRRRCALGALLNMRQEDKPTGPSSSP